MTQIEILEAARPLTDTAWVDELEQRVAEEAFGEALDFHHEELGRKALVVFGRDEAGEMHERTGALDTVPIESIEGAVDLNMPESFMRHGKAGLKRELAIRAMRTETGAERVLTVPVDHQRRLQKERAAVVNSYDRIIGRDLPWRSTRTLIRLAVVTDRIHIQQGRLDLLAQHLPDGTDFGMGRITRESIGLQESRVPA
ncbi:MAG TPA: hypothetical protein VFX86_04210 [Candidatus Saccharimonadales bacterium]|nr:hypothetical protein [Candidatus Saccharimonadales bacterium]